MLPERWTRVKMYKLIEKAPVEMDSANNVGDEMSTLPYHYNWFLITLLALFSFGISNGSDASTLFTFCAFQNEGQKLFVYFITEIFMNLNSMLYALFYTFQMN